MLAVVVLDHVVIVVVVALLVVETNESTTTTTNYAHTHTPRERKGEWAVGGWRIVWFRVNVHHSIIDLLPESRFPTSYLGGINDKRRTTAHYRTVQRMRHGDKRGRAPSSFWGVYFPNVFSATDLGR